MKNLITNILNIKTAIILLVLSLTISFFILFVNLTGLEMSPRSIALTLLFSLSMAILGYVGFLVRIVCIWGISSKSQRDTELYKAFALLFVFVFSIWITWGMLSSNSTYPYSR